MTFSWISAHLRWENLHKKWAPQNLGVAYQAYIPCLKGRRKHNGECEKIEHVTRHGNAY